MSRRHSSTLSLGVARETNMERQAREDSIYRILCEPVPSNASLVSLMKSLLETGESPSPFLVEAVADQLARSKDVDNAKVNLILNTVMPNRGLHVLVLTQ